MAVGHKAIAARNNAIFTNTKKLIKKGICLHQRAIASRETLKKICTTITDCCSIIPYIGAGKNALECTVICCYNEEATLNSMALECQIISNNMDAYNLSPIIWAHHGVHTASPSQIFTPKKPGRGRAASGSGYRNASPSYAEKKCQLVVFFLTIGGIGS